MPAPVKRAVGRLKKGDCARSGEKEAGAVKISFNIDDAAE